jgi:hypothetical protein
MQHVEATSGASRATQAKGHLRPMAREQNAVVGEGIPTEEEVASTPSAEADTSRNKFSA